MSTVYHCRVFLQSVERILEIEDFPKRHTEIQQTETSNGPANPTGRDEALQAIEAGLTRGVEEKIVVAPIAQA